MQIVRALLTLCCLLTGGLVSAQGTDQDNIVVTNDVFEITFSVKGGVPTRWTVLDSKAGPGEPERSHAWSVAFAPVEEPNPIGGSAPPPATRTSPGQLKRSTPRAD